MKRWIEDEKISREKGDTDKKDVNIWDKTKRENDYAEDRLKKIKRLHYLVESHIETKIVYKMIEGVTLGR